MLVLKEKKTEFLIEQIFINESAIKYKQLKGNQNQIIKKA